MPAAGTYRHRVEVQKPTLGTVDENGEQPVTWSRLRTIWAEVKDLAGNEAWRAAQVQPETTVSISFRYWSDMDAGYRFVFGSRTVYPASVVHDVRRRETICLCKEQA